MLLSEATFRGHFYAPPFWRRLHVESWEACLSEQIPEIRSIRSCSNLLSICPLCHRMKAVRPWAWVWGWYLWPTRPSYWTKKKVSMTKWMFQWTINYITYQLHTVFLNSNLWVYFCLLPCIRFVNCNFVLFLSEMSVWTISMNVLTH